MEGWKYEGSEDFWVDVPTESIRFEAYLDGKRYVFAVSQIALNDYYCTSDTLEDAKQNFLDNYDHIIRTSIRFASENEANGEPPHYFIFSDDFLTFA